jgi:hypothetical protein
MQRKLRRAGEKYERTANDPPVDARKPPTDGEPASQSTGGRKDHAEPGEGERPASSRRTR